MTVPARVAMLFLVGQTLACQRTAPSLEPSASAAGTLHSSPPEAASAGPATAGSGAPPRLLPTTFDDSPAASATPSPAAASASAPLQAVPPQPYVVAVVGDSLTDYKSAGGKFIRHLEQRCPESRFDNYGKGGDMVNQMRRRFSALFTSGKPEYSHVVIFGGVNDLYSDLTAGRTNERIQTDLLAMYTSAREHGAKVVAINVAPWGGFKKYFNARRGASTLALNAWIESQRGQSLDAVIDAHTLLGCGDDQRLCPEYEAPFKDGLHFGPEGHRILGQALFEAVFENCR